MTAFKTFLAEKNPELLQEWEAHSKDTTKAYQTSYNSLKRQEAMTWMGARCAMCDHTNPRSLVFYRKSRPEGRKISSRQLYLGILRGEYADSVLLLCYNCMYDNYDAVDNM